MRLLVIFPCLLLFCCSKLWAQSLCSDYLSKSLLERPQKNMQPIYDFFNSKNEVLIFNTEIQPARKQILQNKEWIDIPIEANEKQGISVVHVETIMERPVFFKVSQLIETPTKAPDGSLTTQLSFRPDVFFDPNYTHWSHPLGPTVQLKTYIQGHNLVVLTTRERSLDSKTQIYESLKNEFFKNPETDEVVQLTTHELINEVAGKRSGERLYFQSQHRPIDDSIVVKDLLDLYLQRPHSTILH